MSAPSCWAELVSGPLDLHHARIIDLLVSSPLLRQHMQSTSLCSASGRCDTREEGQAPMSDMNDRFLKTGIFLAPFHPLHENPLLAIDRDMELLEHLDRLNYHEAWIGEHHSAGFEIIACPEMFIAAAAERTRHIRLGTGVVSLPYHNPFTLAGRMQQLDYQTRG